MRGGREGKKEDRTVKGGRKGRSGKEERRGRW
jgi:hypothetical protein